MGRFDGRGGGGGEGSSWSSRGPLAKALDAAATARADHFEELASLDGLQREENGIDHFIGYLGDVAPCVGARVA